MNFHTEGLQSKQIEVLRRMSPLMQTRGFYLAGGTSLAIYFGHRISVDLDWFNPASIGDALLWAQEIHKAHPDFISQQIAPGTLHGSLSGVRVSFLEFQYPFLKSPVMWDEFGCSLASLEDLACMKLSAIAQRGAQGFLRSICAGHKTIFAERDARFLPPQIQPGHQPGIVWAGLL